MSSHTWTQAALQSEFRSYSATVWRCVEAQHRVSTNRLVDSLVEQAVLEKLLDQSKPPMPPEAQHLHFLLATPFRYRTRPGGSRFRSYEQHAGVFYASEAVATAVCESAFYTFAFFADAPDAKLPDNPIEHTAFSASCTSERALDLTVPPLNADSAIWEALIDYGPCQKFSDTAREAGTTVIRFTSVRDLLRGANVAILHPSAFTVTKPIEQQTWRFLVKPQLVVALCDFPRMEYEFPLSMFSADPRVTPLLNA